MSTHTAVVRAKSLLHTQMAVRAAAGRQTGSETATAATNFPVPTAGTPLWKLIIKQFDDLLVKVCC